MSSLFPGHAPDSLLHALRHVPAHLFPQPAPSASSPPTSASHAHLAPMPTDGTPVLLTTRKPPVLPWPDIGHLAKWSVSSYKYGFGPECLRDGDPDTFWHSDGPQPHFITVEFPRKVAVQKVAIYLCFQQDDSYTPATISVRAGTGPSDLQDVRVLALDKPDGWIVFDISGEPNEEGDGFKPLHAYILQLIIVTNHMNGKDTHVRGVRVLGPIEETTDQEDPFPFTTPPFKMYECIR